MIYAISVVRWVATLFVALLCAALSHAAVLAQGAMPGLYDRPVLALDPGMHTAPIRRADVDRDGRIAVTGALDKTVRVWRLTDQAGGAAGSLMRTIRVPTGPGDVGKVYSVAISPDGRTVAASGWT